MQGEILEALKKSERALSAKEISEILGEENKTKVMKAISKLFEYKEVKCIEIDRIQASTYYNTTHRMRLYFLDETQARKTKRTLRKV